MEALFTAFVPIIILTVPFAIGNFFLARALRQSIPIWVILSLIPFLNYLFFIYVTFFVAIHIVRSLQRISAALDVSAGAKSS